MEIATQLYIGRDRPDPLRMQAVRNSDNCLGAKPEGGLWTSTYDPAYGSDWVRWCLTEEFGNVNVGSWLIEPDPGARILTIDTLSDLRGVLAEYGRTALDLGQDPRWCKPDFERLAQLYDGFHLTEAGQWATRLSRPFDLYGWDCESMVWFRPVWASVRSLGRVTWGTYGE